jgi:hypothetical protein
MYCYRQVREVLLALSLSPEEEVFYKTVPQTDINTETGGCMYGEGLLMISA